MSHPFDATVKDLLGLDAADLAPVLGLPTGVPSRPLNVDLSTLSAATDVAFGFGEPLQQIVDVNFQAGPDRKVDSRLLQYSAFFHNRYRVPVRSILVLMRSTADLSHLTGKLAYQAGRSGVKFRYEVVRMWRRPRGPFLTGPLALLPLATLCRLPGNVRPEQAVRAVVQEIERRLLREAPHGQAVRLMTAAYILAGMRVKRQDLDEVFRGVQVMIESSAFEVFEEKGRQKGLQEGLQKGLQEGLQKGRVEEGHRVLLRQGQKRFGEADAATEAALRAVRDLDRLERLIDAVLNASSWPELLATP